MSCPTSREEKEGYQKWCIRISNFSLKLLMDDLSTSLTLSLMHMSAAWWAFVVAVVTCQGAWLYTVIQEKQRQCAQHLHGGLEPIHAPKVLVWGINYHHFHPPPPTLYILSSSVTVSFSLQQHMWFTLGWISTFGRERRGVTLNHSQPRMKCSWRESSLSAAVTAACLIGPSPPCWHDMMGVDAQQQHIGLRC